MKSVALAFGLLCLATVAFAQEATKAELFAGYQLLNGNILTTDTRDNLHGFNIDVAYHATKNIALTGDFGLGTKTTLAAFGGGPVNMRTTMVPLLFGPRFGTTRGKLSPFAEMLIGVTRLSYSPSGMPSESLNKFSFAIGGGVDLNATDKLAVRLAKFDYLAVEGLNGNLNAVRLSTGVVFKF